jgi:hypothetical protein
MGPKNHSNLIVFQEFLDSLHTKLGNIVGTRGVSGLILHNIQLSGLLVGIDWV